MTEKFEILTPREHARLRPGMYLGSTSKETVDQFVVGQWKSAVYIPALLKMINEIIDNSIDEFIRSKYQFATKIDVSIDGNQITVTDNGRGIPQEEVYDSRTEDSVLRPVAAWTRTNAGTSFAENRVSIGSHGLGAALVTFMSSSFVGKTWQNGNLVEVICSDGGLNVEVKQKKHAGNGTSVSFVPDFSLLEVDSLQELDTIELVKDRLTNMQMSFPEITFSFNKEKIKATDLKKYSEMFIDDGASVITEKTDNVSFFFAASVDGFRTNSFINGVNTRSGGMYVDYVVNGVIDELLDLVKKKHKLDVSKSVLKNGLTFVMFARNFVNPKFDSQTKERLTNSITNVKEHYDKAGCHDFKYLAKKIFAANDIIEPIIAAQLAKKLSDETRNALVAQKKLKKVKVAKHIAASGDNATLCLTEGDSALGFGIKVRDPSKIGFYPLRGIIMNTWDMKASEVLKNKELSEVIAILGLDINDPNSADNMTYKYVATLTDADADGSGHISPLIVAFFYKFWPKLFETGRVKITRTPIMISTNGKDSKWFYDSKEATEFKQTSEKYTHRYLKGLGSLTEPEYSRIINDPVWDTVSIDSAEYFQMMFGNSADVRKEFMMK